MTREGINPWNPEVHLKACDTRTLLFYRDQCLKFHGQYDILDNHSSCIVTHEQVKAELATRPHIANKNESKKLRQIMSQTGMTEAEVRQVPKFKAQLVEAAESSYKKPEWMKQA